MARRVSLPLSSSDFGADLSSPTVEQMRKRLGGRVLNEAILDTPNGTVRIGSVVMVGGTRAGVLLALTADSVDVYVSGGLVKRTQRDRVDVHRDPVPKELASIAESATVFARLGEAQGVLVEQTNEAGEVILTPGTLVEKCRYGALVELEDRRVLGVGFRKIWPGDKGASLTN